MDNKLEVFEVIPQSGDNPVYYKVFGNQLLLHIVEITGINTREKLVQLFSFLRTTVCSGACPEVYSYLLFERAATPRIMEEDLPASNQSIYRAIRKLKKNNLIVSVAKSNKNESGGPRSTIYALPDYNSDDILRALEKERKRTVPSFKLSMKMAQLIIDDYFELRKNKEINRVKVMEYIKNQTRSGFYLFDIIRETCRILSQKGYSVVW